MRKWIKDNWLGIIQTIPIIGGVAVAMIGWMRGINWYDIATFLVIFTMLVIPVFLVTVNQRASWNERHKKKLTQLSDKELGTKVLEWVKIPGWSLEPKVVTDGIYFSYVLKIRDILPIEIKREAKDPLVIQLSSGVFMDSKATILSDDDWARLGGRVSIEMARLGIQFMFRGNPNKWNHIQLNESVILDDSMNGFYFRPRVMFVIRAVILVQELWKEALRESGQSTPDKGDSPKL